MRRRKFSFRLLACLSAVAVIMVMAVTVLYAHFVSDKMYKESAQHLEEVYTQVNATFKSLVSNNWNRLSTWGRYIEDATATIDLLQDEGAGSKGATESVLRAFVSGEKKRWKFTEFYFLDGAGNYITIGGERGYIDLGAKLSDLSVNRENIVMDGTLPNSESLTVFAIPIAEGSFDGFSYTAIAVTYNNEDMERALGVNTFSGRSDCFVIQPDGRVLLSATESPDRPFNYLALLRSNAQVLDGDTVDGLQRALAAGEAGVIRFSINDTTYYLAYLPAGFQDWMMLGVVPDDAVNASMSQIQWATVAMVSIVFLAVGVFLASALILRSRRAVKEQQMEVRYRERLFSALSGNTKNIFIMFDPETLKVEYVSPNAKRLLGIDPQRIESDIYVLDGTAVEGMLPLRDDIAALRKVDHHRCCRERIHKDTGERCWYQETMYHASVGDPDKIIYVLADCTREKLNTERLHQALELARQSNEAKSSFLAKMSHDIRTPINAIMGMTQIAKDHMGDAEKTCKCLETIHVSSGHLLSLINDVLDMSKIESNSIELQETGCRLDDVLSSIDVLTRPTSDAKNQKLTIEASAAVHRTFAADGLRLRQILLNLLSNAVKYTPEGGKISLVVTELEPANFRLARLQFVVRDNGMGIDPAFIEDLFAPFERAGDAERKGIQGTGLGMTITKALVDAMGGTIDVESSVGKGTMFTVVLEFRIEEGGCVGSVTEAKSEETDNIEVDEAFRGRRFLAAEDNELNRMILVELLGERGAEVVEARDGAEAVRIFRESESGHFDAVLMDAMMPVMDGYAATRAIRDLAPERSDAATVPIIALTANAYANDVQECLDAGMNAHVSKPFNIDDLAHVLAEHLPNVPKGHT